MARIKFGMMMTDARGKLGGHVFSKSRQGATVRTKVTPINRQTAAQGRVRGILSSLSRAWNELTEAQRIAWNSSSETFKRTNVFGDQVALSGKNLYISLNTNLATVAEAPVNNPPATSDVNSLTKIVLVLSAADQSIAVGIDTTLDIGPDDVLVIEASKPNNAGRFNFSGQYRQLAVSPADDIPLPEDLGASYNAQFGTFAKGQKVSFRMYIINKTSGFASPKVVESAIVTT